MDNNATTEDSELPGQLTIPELEQIFGYESIELRKPIYERFCAEYVRRSHNGCRAYMEVFGEKDTLKARRNASKLLKKVDIRRRILDLLKENKRRWHIQVDDLLEYHGKVLKMDRREFLGEDGRTVKDIDSIDPDAASILEIETVRDSKFGGIQVLMSVPTRQSSAVEMAKILGLHKEAINLNGKIQHSGHVTDNSEERFEALRERFRVMEGGKTDTSS